MRFSLEYHFQLNCAPNRPEQLKSQMRLYMVFIADDLTFVKLHQTWKKSHGNYNLLKSQIRFDLTTNHILNHLYCLRALHQKYFPHIYAILRFPLHFIIFICNVSSTIHLPFYINIIFCFSAWTKSIFVAGSYKFPQSIILYSVSVYRKPFITSRSYIHWIFVTTLVVVNR